MYDFYNKYTKNKCDNKTELLLTDTDNLMCEIEAKNVFEDF